MVLSGDIFASVPAAIAASAVSPAQGNVEHFLSLCGIMVDRIVSDHQEPPRPIVITKTPSSNSLRSSMATDSSVLSESHGVPVALSSSEILGVSRVAPLYLVKSCPLGSTNTGTEDC